MFLGVHHQGGTFWRNLYLRIIDLSLRKAMTSLRSQPGTPMSLRIVISVLWSILLNALLIKQIESYFKILSFLNSYINIIFIFICLWAVKISCDHILTNALPPPPPPPQPNLVLAGGSSRPYLKQKNSRMNTNAMGWSVQFFQFAQ